MKINDQLKKGGWVEWEDGSRFLIRPYPASQIVTSNDPEVQTKNALKMFKYCLINWEGLETADGKPFICNESNKEYIFDHITSVRNFVTDCILESMTKDEADLKN